MLIVSLIVSMLLLCFANLIACRSRHPVPPILFLGLAVSIAPYFMMFFLWTTPIQAALLTVAAAYVSWSGRRALAFLPPSIAATLAAFAFTGWWAWRELSEMREHFPCVSLEASLPVSPPQSHQLSPRAERQLAILEAAVDEELNQFGGFRSRRRLQQLQHIHEDAVSAFVQSPGFGVARLLSPSTQSLSAGLREAPPIPQPAAHADLSRSPGEQDVLLPPPREWSESLFEMHKDNFIDFVHPNGFGYVRDRQHVAGFQSHQFSRTPPWQWNVQTLELVGLLLHEEPVVYVSEHLPRMDELRDVRTRQLDHFEAMGLEALRRGDDLFVRDTAAWTRRMLGPLRATKQCLACHGGEYGDF